MLKDQNDVGQDLDDGIFQMKREEELEVDTDRQLPILPYYPILSG